MKGIILLLGLGFLAGCTIAPTKKAMKPYAYQVEKEGLKGIVAHAEWEHSTFKVQPQDFAESLIEEHCPDGHKKTKVRTEQRAEHRGIASVNRSWKVISYDCK